MLVNLVSCHMGDAGLVVETKASESSCYSGAVDLLDRDVGGKVGWLSFRTEPYTLKISVCFPVFKIYSLFRKLKLQMFCIVRESQEKSHGLPWKAVGFHPP